MSEKKCDDRKGFSYSLEDEKILSYMKLTAEEKLQWLEDINRLTFLVLNDRQKEFREQLRSGKI
jgi:hypothetical protein